MNTELILEALARMSDDADPDTRAAIDLEYFKIMNGG